MSLFGLLFLTADELRELTDLKIPKAQIKWLDKHNYPYEISASGKPKVLRSFVLDKLKSSFQTKTYSYEPNFDAIK